MVQLAHDGLELWYRTPDAPAPDGTTEPRQGVSVPVGVRPANPSNAVSVRSASTGKASDGVGAAGGQRLPEADAVLPATFPTFWGGETVEYVPVVSLRGVARRIRPAQAAFRRRSGSARRRQRAGCLRWSVRPASGVSGQARAHSPRQGRARERAGVLRRYTGRLCYQVASLRWHPRWARIAYHGHCGRETPDDHPHGWDRHPQCQRDGRNA